LKVFAEDLVEDSEVEEVVWVVQVWVVLVEEAEEAESVVLVEEWVEEAEEWVVVLVEEWVEAEVVEEDFLEEWVEAEVVEVVGEVSFVDTTVGPPATEGSAEDTPIPTIIPIMPTEEAMEATAITMHPRTTIPIITTIMRRQTHASAETLMSWPLYLRNNRHV
jgi:hypothetical protein